MQYDIYIYIYILVIVITNNILQGKLKENKSKEKFIT